jgi:hypothetical protein
MGVSWEGHITDSESDCDTERPRKDIRNRNRYRNRDRGNGSRRFEHGFEPALEPAAPL